MRESYHGRYYAKAQNLGRKLTAAYDAALESVDLLVMPTLPMKATPLPPADAPREEVGVVAGLVEEAHRYAGGGGAAGRRLPTPAPAALDLHPHRDTRSFCSRAVEHLLHAVLHRLLEPGVDLFCIALVAFDDDLVVHGEDRHRPRALVAPLVEEREGELQAVRPGALHG
jgi:hypothetical protein